MNDPNLVKFLECIARFSTAMLVTRRGSQLRSRPMAIVDVREPSGRLSFFTRAESGKLDELEGDPNVNVALQDGARYCSVTGVARMVRDPERVARLWQDDQRAWFPDGPSDPSLVLLEIEPQFAEHWDRSGLRAVKYAFSAAAAIVSGEPLDDDVGEHAKLPLE